MRGKVLRIVRDKGYGFLKGWDGVEYFFHKSGFEQPKDFDTLKDGNEVEFEPTNVPTKGPRAELLVLV